MKIVTTIGYLWLCLMLGERACGQDAPKPLPAEVRAAWEKAGAKAGWMAVDGFSLEFHVGGPSGEPGEIRAFQISSKGAKAISAAELAKLPAPAKAFGLHFDEVPVDEAAFAAVAKFKQLRMLKANYSSSERSKITDAGLNMLANLDELRVLDFDYSGITDEGLRCLAAMKQIQGLRLSNSKITDKGLKHVTVLPDLQWLDVSFSQVRDAGLKDLASCKKLIKLNLANHSRAFSKAGKKPTYGDVTEVGLAHLAKIKQLQVLDLSGNTVTRAGLKELAKLKELNRLELYATGITERELSELSRLRGLLTLGLGRNLSLSACSVPISVQNLDLGITAFSDSGVRGLAVQRQLRTLNLASTKLTDAGVVQIAWLGELRTLDLSSLKDVTGASVKELAKLKKLETLNLSKTKIGDIGLDVPGGFTQLRHLNVHDTAMTSKGVKHLGQLKQLRSLDVSDNEINNAVLKIAAGMNQLESLNLYHTDVTDAGLKELTGLKELRWLEVGGTFVTDDGIAMLKRAMPKLEISKKPSP